ncbi:uncharacterized protein LOC115624257 [Scaptodrosophila lebanonensis]|uniref:Uncharacterized protein LOC115624257 n=1 Tax=Drosophila lebanonensis TaxID=7225 RepID=A0A6J2TD78_DROLE|nr:uncharacterized protein LOC115624257 [Scaptodrosophila lebanonensis]
MNFSWRTFPKLFVVIPILHYVLSLCVDAESKEHKRLKELEKAKRKSITIAKSMEGQKN